MSGKGDKRRPEDKAKIAANWARIFAKPMECPRCGEIELRKIDNTWYECDSCGHKEQH